MLFNSFQYLLFFPVVCLLYFASPFRWRTAFLLLASYYFYMCWRWEYVAPHHRPDRNQLPLRPLDGEGQIAPSQKGVVGGRDRADAGDPLLLQILQLRERVASRPLRLLAGPYHVPRLDILLPIGISFHTFQTLSYTIDLYRGRIPVERSFTEVCALRLLLPAARRRADRAGQPPAAPVRAREPFRCRPAQLRP